MQLFRIAQFVDAVISLILYGIYIAHLISSTGSPEQAVLGIAGACVIWAVTAFATHTWNHRQNLKSGKAAKGMLRKGGIIAAAAVAFILIDFCFIALFAASAGITGSQMRNCRVVRGGGGEEDNLHRRDDNDNNSSSSSSTTSTSTSTFTSSSTTFTSTATFTSAATPTATLSSNSSYNVSSMNHCGLLKGVFALSIINM